MSEYVLCSQSLGVVLKKLKLTQQKHTYTNKLITQNNPIAQRDGRPAEYIGGALCSTPQSLADAHY